MDRPVPKSREDALMSIAASSVIGYLGLFVGSGFSKAATVGRAPSFEQLLRSVAERLGSSPDFDKDPGCRLKSLSQIASKLLRDVTVAKGPSGKPGDAFREVIATLCNLVPDPSVAVKMRAALQSIRPSWIVTTNYDLILEALIEDSESVIPPSPLVPNASRPPIYHLHGHRHSPSTIKITEEDYVGLLGPIDYQRLKLPLLFFESATVMLGYALGDINVRAAIGWSRSFQTSDGVRLPPWQGRVFHAVRKASPTSDPYVGPDGEVVLEISDITSFLEEMGAKRRVFDAWLQQFQASIDAFLADPENAATVATDPVKRAKFLEIVSRGSRFSSPTKMVEFLSQVLDPVWVKARENGGFAHYDTYMTLLIDVLEKIKVGSAGPLLIFFLGDAVDKIGWYLDKDKSAGSAFAATDTWLAQHQRVAMGLKSELKAYADAYGKVGLLRALEYGGVPAV